jgi:predicted nucleic acid-binding protein
MAHLVIADAGPLIGLARIQRLQLLKELFVAVTITTAVAQELGCGMESGSENLPAGAAELSEALAQGWLAINGTADGEPYQPLNPGVDAGEASAIALALRKQAEGDEVMLLIDDRCGRAEARHRGLNLIGTAAVIVLAREQGLIGACAPLLHALREQGYYLSDGLIQAVLRQVSEA